MKMFLKVLALGAVLQAAAWSTGVDQANAQVGPLDPVLTPCLDGQIEVDYWPYCVDPNNPGNPGGGGGGGGGGGECISPPCLPGKPCLDPCPTTEPQP